MGPESIAQGRKLRKLNHNIPSKKSPIPKRNELAALRMLLELSTRPASQDNLDAIVNQVLETAIALSGADMGNIQLFDQDSRALKIVAHRGFQKPFLDFFAAVYPETGGCGTVCGAVFSQLRQIIVEDVSTNPIFAGTPALAITLETGARACQSTPLLSRDGQLVGMLNTHFRRTICKDELDMRFLDLLAGQTADIIIQVRAEAALRESENRYRTIFETAGEGITHAKSDGTHLYCNQRFADMLGYSKDEIHGKLSTALCFVDEQPQIRHIRRTLNKGDVLQGEFRLRRKDGSELWTMFSGTPVFNADGEHIFNFAMHTDITERKRLEHELQQHRENLERLVEERTAELKRSERHYRALVENLPLTISRFDKEFRYKYRSPSGEGRFGNAADVIGKTWSDLGVPDTIYYGRWQERFTEALNTGQLVQYETRHPDKQGEWRDYLTQVIPEFDEHGEIDSFLTTTMDITERKRNQELLTTVLEGMKDGFYVLDPELRFIYVNRGIGRVWGLSPEALVGKSIAAVFPGIIEVSLEKFRQALATQTPQDYEVMSQVANCWYHIHVCPLREGLAVFCLNIENRKRAEEALNQSEDRFRKIFDTSPVMIVIIRMADNKYVEINNKFLDVIGYTRDEAIGRTPQELGLWAVDAGKGEALLTDLREKGEYHNTEGKITTKTGKTVTALTSSLPITFNGEQCRLAMMQDITKEKRMEDDLLRLDRLNTVGEMAAALGHEVRNPMTTVRGYLQLMQRKEESAAHREKFKLMIDELDRANTIISDFLSLAKNKVVEFKPGNLNTIITSLLPLLQADALRTGHEITTDLGDIPDIRLVETEIRQMLLNLARNGLEAMKAGGRLTILTYSSKDKIVLGIHDTGPGIPGKVLKKLGTPTTTKENGTGLGLPVCYRIADRHGATIDVQTSTAGTTFIVNFPVHL